MSERMTRQRLAELRAIAEAARTQPWEAIKHRRGLTLYSKKGGGYVVHPDLGMFNSDADAIHAATFDPPTVLALLDALERSRATVPPAPASPESEGSGDE